MPKSSFVDFKAVKAAITMEKVLEHYGLLDRFKKSGDSMNGPCPIHKGSNPTQFRVSISKAPGTPCNRLILTPTAALYDNIPVPLTSLPNQWRLVHW